jgi:hypothetical protein
MRRSPQPIELFLEDITYHIRVNLNTYIQTESQIAKHLQPIISSSEVKLGIEELTITPPIFPALPTSITTVLSPFPTTNILFPTATIWQGGLVNKGDNLPTGTHSLVSFRHIISLVPEL